MTSVSAAYLLVCSVWCGTTGIAYFCKGHAFNLLKIFFNTPESAGGKNYFLQGLCVGCVHR